MDSDDSRKTELYISGGDKESRGVKSYVVI